MKHMLVNQTSWVVISEACSSSYLELSNPLQATQITEGGIATSSILATQQLGRSPPSTHLTVILIGAPRWGGG